MKENMQFPNPCPHCGKSNRPKKWCYETIGEDGTIYGFCNHLADPAVGWERTEDRDANSVPKYVYVESRPVIERPQNKITSHFEYRNGNNNPIIRETRVDYPDKEKEIFLESYDNGKWIKGGSKLKEAPIYRYPEIQKAIGTGQKIFICEGAKVANLLVEMGLEATTNIGGSKKWHPKLTESLAGAKVVICPDQDKPGILHAEVLAKEFPDAQWLYAYPLSPKWRFLPSSGGLDLYDYIKQYNRKKDELLSQITDKPIHSLEIEASGEGSSAKAKLDKLLGYVRDQLAINGVLEEADLVYISQETKIPVYLCEKICQQQNNRLLIQENLKEKELRKFFDYQSRQLNVEDYISDRYVANQIHRYSEALRIDSIFVLTFLLPLIGGRLGSKVCIKERETWKEYPTFWTTVIAPPSSSKSVVYNHLYAPIVKQDKENEDRANANYERLKQVQARWDRMNYQQQEQNADNPEVNPDLFERQYCPPARVTVVQSATPEGFMSRLSEQPDDAGVIWTMDELSGLFKNLDRYSKNGDSTSFFLSAWSSHCQYHSVQRRGKADSYRLGEQTISITGGIQPDRFTEVFKLSGDGSGFCSRWLYAVPQPHPLFTQYTNESVNLQGIVQRILDKLDTIPVGTEVKLSVEAHKRWRKIWELYQEQVVKCQKDNPPLAEYLGKMKTYLLRLSLFVHLLDYCFEKTSDLEYCSASAFIRASRIASHYIGQFRLLQLNDKNCDKEATFKSYNFSGIVYEIAEWVKSQENSTASLRDINRRFNSRSVNGIRLKKEIIKDLIDSIVNISYGYYDEEERFFTYREPTIKDALHNVKRKKTNVEIPEPKFKIGDLVAITKTGDPLDGFLTQVEESDILEVKIWNPLKNTHETISVDFCEIYTDTLELKCQEAAEALKTVDNTQKWLEVLVKYSRYVAIAFNSYLDEADRLYLQSIID